MASSITIEFPDDRKIWINPQQILKMEKTPDDHYFIHMANGEVFEIGRRTAGNIESYFEDLF